MKKFKEDPTYIVFYYDPDNIKIMSMQGIMETEKATLLNVSCFGNKKNAIKWILQEAKEKEIPMEFLNDCFRIIFGHYLNIATKKIHFVENEESYHDEYEYTDVPHIDGLMTGKKHKSHLK